LASRVEKQHVGSYLITGATGFIGVNLAAFLARRGHHVRCLVRPSATTTALKETDCEIVSGDVLDESSLAQAVRGVGCVINLAGLTAAFSKEAFLKVNATGAYNVARACALQKTPPVLIQVSSIAAAGPALLGEARLESDDPSPISLYGESKLAGERRVAEFASDVPITVLRPGIVFGPYDRAMLPIYQTIRNVRFHAVPTLRPPPLSYIYVDDFCDLVERAAVEGERLPLIDRHVDQEGLRGHGIYFAVDSEHPNYADLGRFIRPLLNRPFAPIIPLPSAVPMCLAKAAELVARVKGRPGQLNPDKILEARATSWECSHLKAKEQLGFVPARAFSERLQQTVEWYRSARWL